MLRKFLMEKVDKYDELEASLAKAATKATEIYNEALATAEQADYQSAASAFDRTIQACQDAIDIFLDALAYYNNYIWTKAYGEDEERLLGKIKSNLTYSGLFVDADLVKLHKETGKGPLYMTGVSLYKQLAIAYLRRRDFVLASMADVAANGNMFMKISWLTLSDVAFAKAIDLRSALGLNSIGHFAERKEIEVILDVIAKHDLLDMLKSPSVENKAEIFKLILNGSNSIFAQRLWKKEGLFECNTNSGTLAEIKKAYDELPLDGLGEPAPEQQVASSSLINA